jgi:uncharacterized protein (TIGR03437 family)
MQSRNKLLVIAAVVIALMIGTLTDKAVMEVHAKYIPSPPLSVTGAPGEGTCVGCHYTFGGADGIPDIGAGKVQITGLPTVYTPGQTYTVTVTVSDAQARRWGFEVTAIDSSGASANAGTFEVIDGVRTLLSNTSVDGKARSYVSHKCTNCEDSGYQVQNDGTYPGRTGSNAWTFRWTAPVNSLAGDVTFYATGNAADNQTSPEGDYIYSTTIRVHGFTSSGDVKALSQYLVASGSASLNLQVLCNPSENSPWSKNILFKGQPYPGTVTSGNPNLDLTIPAGALNTAGAFSLSTLYPNGYSPRRTLVIASSINSREVTTVEAATYATTVAPGQIAALFGTELTANGNAAGAPSVPLPFEMQGTSVFVNGSPAPLFYVSATQINFQIPYGVLSGPGTVVVFRNDGVAARGTVTVAEKSPAIFTFNSSGTGQAAALNQDFSLNGDPSVTASAKRAKKGQFVTLYGSGTGTRIVSGANNASPIAFDGAFDGKAATTSPLITTELKPVATIGGKAAEVAFSGLVPGLVGLWQINARVPADAPSGTSVPVIVRFGDGLSRTVTIAVE